MDFNSVLFGVLVGMALAIAEFLVLALCAAASQRDDERFQPEPWVNGEGRRHG